ncbi:NAD-dependent epimerase/dehydratase family protein [Actinophytocola gossypii]|uniref:NAD-dependent epimerase/dehydratase family protein n=1 Tax=Actinophytocola gossypii TaxID=2812003 RepID=A0ABT2J638_9PSEU|nr:NAD-dependent epimerase/dehydratase family protein [Actinophytocola gossypii]MCT2582955.1 NAD-dependent epimerase/dehydratase family protein [Actinophytocola gossypii]
MRVLITGAAGFVGSHVADSLAERGHDTVLLDNLSPKAHGPQPTDTHLVVGDVRDGELLARLLRGVDVVCHQAAVVGHGLDPSDAPDYALHNDYGTAVLLAAMHRVGVRRLVLASSMVVYGEGRYRCPNHGEVRPGPRHPDDLERGRFEPLCPDCGADLTPALVGEDAAIDPRSTYAATKAAQEHLASAWARQTGGAVLALRYHNVYGPRMPRDTPYAGVASLFRSALRRGEAPTVLEDGRQLRDFVHVTDVALANALAVETGETDETGKTGETGETGESAAPSGALTAVNVCSGEPHTVLDMATELASACDGPSPRVVGGARPGDVRHVVADPARARKLLGFTARTPFARGIAEFASAPLRAPAAVTGSV